MEFELSPTQEAARAAVEQLIAGPSATTFSPPSWRTTWAALVDSGLVELIAPESEPSSETDTASTEADSVVTGIETCEILRGLGLRAVHVPLLGAVALAPVLARDSVDAVREHWLPRLRSGSALVTPAVGEAAGGAPDETGTRAFPDGSGWRLTGSLLAVPFADEVDRLVLWAATPDQAIGVFLVDPQADGVVAHPTVSTTGEREYAVALNGVRVEPLDVVAAPGVSGERAARRLYQHLLVGLAAEQLGLAETALEMTARYVSSRKQFGQPIGAFQAVSTRAADAYIDLTAMRWTMYRAAETVYAGTDAGAEVAVAKFWAADGGARILAAAVHLHGGLGVDTTYPLHRYFLRGKRVEVMLGGTGTQLARLWDALAGREAVHD